MSIVFSLFLGLFTFWGLAFLQAPSWVWSAIFLFVGLSGWSLGWWGLFGFSLFAAAVAVGHLAPLRQKLITRPVFWFLKRRLPPMSQTEREAIEAGDVWIDQDLFQGRPDFTAYQNLPVVKLSEREQAFYDDKVRALCRMLDEWHITRERLDLPPAVWDYLKNEQFFAMNIPVEHGGLGFSAEMQSRVVATIGTRSATAAVTAMVPNSLGPAELIIRYGTAEQKAKYLPGLASGQTIPCFGLTAPKAGSDAGAIPDKGIVVERTVDGETQLGIELTFSKRYITLAPVADLIGLAIKLYDPEHLLSDTVDRGITLCLIERDAPGLQIGERHLPAGSMFLNGPMSGENLFIPFDQVIGGQEQVGQGWRMLMECLSEGRGISLPALATAGCHLSFRMAGAYALLREQFNLSIGAFDGVKAVLGRIGGLTYSVEATRQLTAQGIDLGLKPAIVSAIAKYNMTEVSRAVINDAMDVHAGRGLMTGPRNYLSAMQVSSSVSITVEGANILTRNLIIFGQGAMRAHPFLQEEVAAISSDDAASGMKTLDGILYKHVRYALFHWARSVAHSVSGFRFVKSTRTDDLACYERQIAGYAHILAFTSDVALLLLGGALKRKETLSARLGDVLSALYISIAVLKYYDQNGEPDDIPFVKWALKYHLYNAQEAMCQFFENFPTPWMGKVLKRVSFPWGRRLSLPRDELSFELADTMMSSGSIRERLAHCLYYEENDTDPVGVVEQAFRDWHELSDLLKQIKALVKEGTIPRQGDRTQQAAVALEKGLITQTDYERIVTLSNRIDEVIRVDTFHPETLSKAELWKQTQTVETSTS